MMMNFFNSFFNSFFFLGESILSGGSCVPFTPCNSLIFLIICAFVKLTISMFNKSASIFNCFLFNFDNGFFCSLIVSSAGAGVRGAAGAMVGEAVGVGVGAVVS